MLDLHESAAAFAGSVAAVRTTRDVIVAAGADVAGYLHGQLSQNVTGLGVGRSALTLLLQPQGKIDARLRLSRPSADQWWLDLEAGFGEAALARLERFKLRVDAEFTLHSWPMVAVRGPDAGSLLDDPDRPDTRGSTLVLDAHWPGVVGVDLLGPNAAIPDGIPEADPEALEALRITVGVAAMGTELTERTIPAAAAVVDDAVDFTKGCYVGQELVARVDSRGSNTPTNLRRITFEDLPDGVDPTAIGLRSGDDEIGTVTSLAATPSGGAIALAYVKRAIEVPVSAIALVGGEPYPVEVLPLPDRPGAPQP